MERERESVCVCVCVCHLISRSQVSFLVLYSKWVESKDVASGFQFSFKMAFFDKQNDHRLKIVTLPIEVFVKL